MKVFELTYRVPPEDIHVDYIRDPQPSGSFIRGVLCNEMGIAQREGCSDETDLMVMADRVIGMREVAR